MTRTGRMAQRRAESSQFMLRTFCPVSKCGVEESFGPFSGRYCVPLALQWLIAWWLL